MYNGDYGWITAFGTRNLMDMFLKYPDIVLGITTSMASLDYFHAGFYFGKLWKNMFDDNQKA